MTGLSNAHALVIGIANYQYVTPLRAAVLADARDVYALLVDPEYAGYPLGDVQLLLDGQASREAICQALATLADHADEDAIVFLYVSSHGHRVEHGPAAGEYLLPVDTDCSSDQALAETAISSTQLSKALRRIRARKVVVVFDCCHAAGLGQPKNAAAPELRSGLSASFYDRLAEGTGWVILAAADMDEASYIQPQAANSLFTEHLLAGLRGGAASDDGMIRIFDLFEYIQPRVVLTQAGQHPVFKAQVRENFPVALFRGGERGVVPTVDDRFRYDAYLSFVDSGADADCAWKTLKPRLEAAGLRIAVSEDIQEPGVEFVLNAERGIQQSRRTVVLLSKAYMADRLVAVEGVLAMCMGIYEGTYRVLPVKIEPIDEQALPIRLRALATVDLTHSDADRIERQFERLVRSLRSPLPQR
jgi:hypothetical protein